MSWFPRLSQNLKEVRIHLSQTAPGSKGARDFIANQYLALKKANPELPILVREANWVEARVFGRYAFGQERKISLDQLDENQVAEQLKQLAETSPSSSQRT
ncbi:ndufa2, NADH:ubiquinone oxidoreductase 10.5kD subunit [Blyttiomyces sp. JEL0837]|nr:ndufa2, NADH:ubiquinone oxidoreductase 10.5kD subunit [Blyttiomyces sp. JEL0837]